jgi:hypothetical protein
MLLNQLPMMETLMLLAQQVAEAEPVPVLLHLAVLCSTLRGMDAAESS